MIPAPYRGSPSVLRYLPPSPRAKENLPSLKLSDQLKKWEAITVENHQSLARYAVPYALLSLGAPCACPTAAADRCNKASARCNDSGQDRL